MEELIQLAALARREGTTYGKLVARYTTQELRARLKTMEKEELHGAGVSL